MAFGLALVMPPANMTSMPLTADEQQLFNALSADGSPSTNAALRALLGWSEEKYWPIQRSLISQEVALPSRGRGGLLRRVVNDAQRDQAALLARVPADGSSKGNISLMRELGPDGWSEDKYWRVRDELIDLGRLVAGRGKGGSVHRVLEVEDPVTAALPGGPAAYDSEAALYEPMKNVLERDWGRDFRLDPDALVVETTASQGSRSTGGTWTRPDLTLVSKRKFTLSGSTLLDVITFEAKLAGKWNVTGIFEAAAHSRRATHSYAFFHYVTLSDTDKELVERCEREARAQGVGLILATDPAQYATWEFRVEAPRLTPDAEELESFLATQLSDATHDKLKGWWA